MLRSKGGGGRGQGRVCGGLGVEISFENFRDGGKLNAVDAY